jgi:hypothetical protein
METYIGKDVARRMFIAGAISASIEKKAQDGGGTGNAISSAGKWLAGLVGGGAAVGKGAYEAGKEGVGLAGNLALMGLGTGVLGGIGYHLIKERLQQKSPEEEMNRKIESMYSRKSKELESSKKMTVARALRDELNRGRKTMSTDEYRTKYDKLMSIIEEMS